MDELDAIFAIDDESPATFAAADEVAADKSAGTPAGGGADHPGAEAVQASKDAPDYNASPQTEAAADIPTPLATQLPAASPFAVDAAPASDDVSDFLAELDSVIASATASSSSSSSSSAASSSSAPAAPAVTAATANVAPSAPIASPPTAVPASTVALSTSTTAQAAPSTAAQAEPTRQQPAASLAALEAAVADFTSAVEQQSDAPTPFPSIAASAAPARVPVRRKKGWDEESLSDLREELFTRSQHPDPDIIANMCVAGMMTSAAPGTATATADGATSGTGSGVIGIPPVYRARVWEVLLSSLTAVDAMFSSSSAPSPMQAPALGHRPHQQWDEVSPLVSSAISSAVKEGLAALGLASASSSDSASLALDGVAAVTAAVLALTNELTSNSNSSSNSPSSSNIGSSSSVFAPVPSGLVPLACSLFFAVSQDPTLVEEVRLKPESQGLSAWLTTNLRRLVKCSYYSHGSSTASNANSSSGIDGLHDALRSLLVYVEPKLVSRLDGACPGWCQPHNTNSGGGSSSGGAGSGAGEEGSHYLFSHPNACIPAYWLDGCFTIAGAGSPAVQPLLLPLMDRLILSLHTEALHTADSRIASASGSELSLSLLRNVPALALPSLLMAAVLILQESAGLYIAASSASSLPSSSPTATVGTSSSASSTSSSPAAYLLRMTLKGALANRLSTPAAGIAAASSGAHDPVSSWLVDAAQLSRRLPTSALSSLERRATRSLLMPSQEAHKAAPVAAALPSAVHPTSISAEELSCHLLYGFDVMCNQRNALMAMGGGGSGGDDFTSSAGGRSSLTSLLLEVEGVGTPTLFPLLSLSAAASRDEEVQVREALRAQQEEEQAEAVIRAAEEAAAAAEEAAVAEEEQRRLEGEAAERDLAAATTIKALGDFVGPSDSASGEHHDHHDEEAARAAAVVSGAPLVGPTGNGTALQKMRDAAKAAYANAQAKAAKLQEEMKKRREQAVAAAAQRKSAEAGNAQGLQKKGSSFDVARAAARQEEQQGPQSSSASASSFHWMRPARFLVVDLRPISHRRTGRMATAFHIDPRTIRVTDTSDDAVLAMSPKPDKKKEKRNAEGDENDEAEEDRFVVAGDAKAAAAAHQEQQKLAEEPSEASAYSAEGLPLKVAIAQIVAMCRSADEEAEDNRVAQQAAAAEAADGGKGTPTSFSSSSKKHYSTTDSSGAVHIAVLGVSPSDIHHSYLAAPAGDAASGAAEADDEDEQRRREMAFFDAVDEDRAKSLAVARALIEAGCRRVSIVDGGFSRIHKMLKEPQVYLPPPASSASTSGASPSTLRYRTVIMHHAPSRCPYCRHAKVEKALRAAALAGGNGSGGVGFSLRANRAAARQAAAAAFVSVRGNLTEWGKSWRAWANKQADQYQLQQQQHKQRQGGQATGGEGEGSSSGGSPQWQEALGQFLAATSTTGSGPDGADSSAPLGQYLPGQGPPNKLAQNLDAALDTLEDRALVAAKRITAFGVKARQQLLQAFEKPQGQQQQQQQQPATAPLDAPAEPLATKQDTTAAATDATAATATATAPAPAVAATTEAPKTAAAPKAATAAPAKTAWGSFLAAGAAVLSAPPASNPAATAPRPLQAVEAKPAQPKPTVAGKEDGSLGSSAPSSSATTATLPPAAPKLTFSALKAAAAATAAAAASAATAATAAATGARKEKDKDGDGSSAPAATPAARPSLSSWFSKKDVTKAAPTSAAAASAAPTTASTPEQRSRAGSTASVSAPPDPEAAVRLLELSGMCKGTAMELQRYQAYTYLFRASKELKKDKEKEKPADAAEADAAPAEGESGPTRQPRYLCLAKERLLVLEAHPTKMGVGIVKSNAHVSSLAKMTFAKKNPNKVTLWKRKAPAADTVAAAEGGEGPVLAERVYYLEGEGSPGETFRKLLVEAINRLK